MNLKHNKYFQEDNVIRHLKHYLPAQAPLKDFIHHNTLHAFQDRKFFKALAEANEIFGYKTSLSITEYRKLYHENKISKPILKKIIFDKKGKDQENYWIDKLLSAEILPNYDSRISKLRNYWKSQYAIDLDLIIHPFLFRYLCSYLDQGISIWRFPITNLTFLEAIREIETNSYFSFFKKSRAKKLLFEKKCEIADLLAILVGDEELYEHYLYDQQFAHPGWSGIISIIEDQPHTLIDERKISLKELIFFELLLEIDALDDKFNENWSPLALRINQKVNPLFSEIKYSENHEILSLWQEAYEWTYYDQVLGGIMQNQTTQTAKSENSFQALFCIDDREYSMRRYIEQIDKKAATFGTPGFFGVAFYFKPMQAKFSMKVCPAPLNPNYVIKEEFDKKAIKKDFHFSDYTHSLFWGWLVTHTIGFWSVIRLFISIFKPSISPATTWSFRHMHKNATLGITNHNDLEIEDGKQIGFTIDEMANRVEGLLKSIGLVENFAPIVYAVGHGASSVNNTHYAGYDCGACSGRPGSVNARVISFMANHKDVRTILQKRGINIPESTIFIGALHDTTRDEIEYYDKNFSLEMHKNLHKHVENVFNQALSKNAFERSRRFLTTKTYRSIDKTHEKVKLRSVSLFEPRPELNHATNSLCIIAKSSLTKNLFLDRRAFMNSYDYSIDLNGEYLFQILSAAAPVCGGINLEYYFSRVDNLNLGAGSKLPHNVMGLIGVANGIDGDLRTGLPNQMIEVHDPLRLLIIVEHYPQIILQTIFKSPQLSEWFTNEWINLVAINPESKEILKFENDTFIAYTPNYILPKIDVIEELFLNKTDNIPVYQTN